MTGFLLDDRGQPVYVRGYAAIWNAVSFPHPMWGDRPGLFLPSAFDAVLKRPRLSVTCQAYHLAHAVLGSYRDENLQIWKDSTGLAFCAGPVPVRSGNVNTVNAIAAGKTRGASIEIETAEERGRIINGEEVVVVKRIKALYHLGPVAVPSFDATAVWLSTEEPHNMPPRIRALADIWSANRPHHDTPAKLRHMAQRVPARKPAPRAHRATVPMAMRDIYPAGLGFSSAELGRLAILDTTAQRAFKAVEALRFERQRETNRARRRARSAA